MKCGPIKAHKASRENFRGVYIFYLLSSHPFVGITNVTSFVTTHPFEGITNVTSFVSSHPFV